MSSLTYDIICPKLIYYRYEAEELASSLGLVLYTTSAKENVNIETVFHHLAERFCKDRDKDQEHAMPRWGNSFFFLIRIIY